MILIRQRSLIGQLPGGHDVYKINKVVILNLNLEDVSSDFNIEVLIFLILCDNMYIHSFEFKLKGRKPLENVSSLSDGVTRLMCSF